jgi:hypothetical protein
MAVTDDTDARLATTLRIVCGGLPSDLRGPVKLKLESLWVNPRAKAVSAVLDDAELTEECVRQLLFSPDGSQAALYARLIVDPPAGAAQDHAQVRLFRSSGQEFDNHTDRFYQRVVQIECLTMLYLLHIPHGDWHTFSEPFILAGRP